jgi:hypothetical protein
VANVLGNFHDQIAFAHFPFAADLARRALDQRLLLPDTRYLYKPAFALLVVSAQELPFRAERGIYAFLISTVLLRKSIDPSLANCGSLRMTPS